MGQKHSSGGGTRVDGGGRTVVVIGGNVDAGHRGGGGGDAIGIINEDDESETPETCTKSFSDNNLAWYSRPWKIIESPTEPTHRKPPSVEVLTSSNPSSNNAPSQTRGRSRPKSAGLPRQRPSSGLFWKPPPMPWFGRSASKTNGGSTATIACTDLTGVINNGGQQRPVRPVTVVGAPGNSNADDATYRSMLAAAGREKSPAAVEEMDDVRDHVSRVVGRPIIEEVLRQTVDFLVHEIEPVLIAEYLKHQRRSRRRNGKQSRPNGVAVVGDDITPSSPSSPAFMNERELRALLADIILGPSMMTDDAYFRHQNETTVADQNGTDPLSEMSPSTASCWSSEDDFWTFCRLLRKLDADRKSGEFLEALGAVLRIVAPCRCHQCSVRPAGDGVLPGSTRTTSSRQASTPGDAQVDEHGLHERVADSEEDSSDPDDDVSDAAGRRRRRHQFDVKIVYVDSETRVPRSFDDVAQLKRCRRRKSRIGLVPKENDAKLQQQQQQHHHHPAVVVGDTADRYIPMVVVRVSGLDGLCEVRTRRIEHLLDDFPERILRLTIADVDLDPSSTLRLSRAVERHPATGLRTLRVVRSSLGNDGATLLATGLSHNTGLRSLCLAGNGMTSRGCAIVVRALLRRSTPCGTGGRTLTELDISDNPGIGDAGFRPLLSALRLPGCPLRRLSVRRIGLSPSAAGDLFAALGRNSRLVALDVGGNRLVDRRETNASGSIGTTTNERDGEQTDAGDEPTAFVRLAESLIVNRTLRDLVADDECGATVDECRQLARALRTNTAVRRLRLDGNAAIGDAGAELLADGLRFNRGGIEELGLAGCSIGDRGLAAIVDAATRYNSTTKVIDLRRCRRRRSGASVSVSASPPIIQRQQQQQQSDCFVLTVRTVPPESPDSDGNSCSMPAAEVDTVAEDDDAFSAAPPSSPSVVNGHPEKSPGRMYYVKRCFDPQLVELVEGLSRPRIILD